jgi:aminopeptidase N
VKLNYPYTDDDLIFLSHYDKDLFNRYEAAQQYYLQTILRLVKVKKKEEMLQLPNTLIEMFNFTLHQDTTDLLLLSEMLVLPSEKYISEHMDIIDVDAIHHVREFIITEIAKELYKIWHDSYNRFNTKVKYKSFNMDAVGQRQFKNRCLHYLMQLPNGVEIGMKQFESSLTSNMTDTLAALSALTNLDFSDRQTVLDDFYRTWKDDPLVVDKWFAIQASSKLSSSLHDVKLLCEHEAFDIKNPNKVYALLGTFGQRNRVNFHAKGGEAYVFLRDKVLHLDRLNPQVAARMIKPLTTWQRYDNERQILMRKQLEILRQENISTDLYELVTKSL